MSRPMVKRASRWRSRVSYDAAIVDVMLPRLDGLALIDRIRARGVHTPVLILSARRTVDDRVRACRLAETTT